MLYFYFLQCTCGAKSRKEKQKTLGVRDIGVNCPTPPILAQELQPVATDIAVLKAGPVEDIVSNPISPPASLVKLSLQDAFMYSKQDFIERSRERLKKVKEKCEERKYEKTTGAQVVVVVPSEKMKAKKEDKKPDEDKMQDMKSTKQFGKGLSITYLYSIYSGTRQFFIELCCSRHCPPP